MSVCYVKQACKNLGEFLLGGGGGGLNPFQDLRSTSNNPHSNLETVLIQACVTHCMVKMQRNDESFKHFSVLTVEKKDK